MNDPFFSKYQRTSDSDPARRLGNQIVGAILLGSVAVSFLFSCKNMQISMQINDLHFSTQQNTQQVSAYTQSASIWGDVSIAKPDKGLDWETWLSENRTEVAAVKEVSANGTNKEATVSSAAELKRQRQIEYVQRYGPIAKEEMKKYGIPASITLAQGLLESNVGNSILASNFKNHFGIKCFEKGCKPGHCGNYSDDSHKDFFRKYNSVWESYRAHSIFLQKDRYQSLFKLSKKDYKSWAHGLKKAGYATDKRYAYKLIKLIEDLRLYQWDK